MIDNKTYWLCFICIVITEWLHTEYWRITGLHIIIATVTCLMVCPFLGMIYERFRNKK